MKRLNRRLWQTYDEKMFLQLKATGAHFEHVRHAFLGELVPGPAESSRC